MKLKKIMNKIKMTSSWGSQEGQAYQITEEASMPLQHSYLYLKVGNECHLKLESELGLEQISCLLSRCHYIPV